MPAISRGVSDHALKVVIYGPGGIGKTSLVANAAKVGLRPLVVDLDSGSHRLNVARIEPTNWNQLRQVLQDNVLLGEFDIVAVDSLTRAEELALAWTLENVPHEKGHKVSSIEGYGFGKGYTHVYETFLTMLGDLDALARRGKHVVGIAHDCVATAPNPKGDDWQRWEPRLQCPPKQGQTRYRVKEWCDHMLFVGYDVNVNKDGKATSGSATRAIYPCERPTHMAKSRSLTDRDIPYKDGDATIWNLLLGKETQE